VASVRHWTCVMSSSLSWIYSELHGVRNAHHPCCWWLLQMVARNLQTARLRQLLQSWTVTTTALHAWRQLKQQACMTGKQSLLKRALTGYACISLYMSNTLVHCTCPAYAVVSTCVPRNKQCSKCYAKDLWTNMYVACLCLQVAGRGAAKACLAISC